MSEETTKKRPRGAPFPPPHLRSVVGTECPKCGKGKLRTKWGKNSRTGEYFIFAACDQWPACDRIHKSASTDPTPETEPVEPAPAPVAASGSVANPIAKILEDLQRAIAEQNGASEERVRAIIHEEIGAIKWDEIIGPRPIEIRVNDLPPVAIEGVAHKALTRLVALAKVMRNDRRAFNIFLVGPTGCGKTTLGRQLTTAMGWDPDSRFAALSCAPGITESALIGRMIPNLSTGEERLRLTRFVEIYTNGGVYLIDEIDNSDPSMLLVMNSAIDNGHLTLPNGETVKRHKDAIIVAAGNTFGHGADREYVGRTQLDAATLDRYIGGTISIDYDRDMERALCANSELRNRVWNIRDKVRSLKLRRRVSTRFLLGASALVDGVGDTIDEAIRACMEDWNAQDLQAVGMR